MLSIRINMEMCRVCFKAGAGISLLDEDHLDKFNQITGLMASPEDGLPSALCPKCLSKLNVAHDFRKQSIASENHLINFIAQVNKEFEHKIPVIESEYDKSGGPTDMDLELFLENSCNTAEEAEFINSGVDAEKNDEAIEYVKMNFTLKDIIEEDTTESTEKDEIMEIEELNEEVIERIVETPLESYDVVDVASSAATSSQKTERIARRYRNSTLESNFCVQCQKDFSTKTNLRRHMLTHSSQKPFQCSICGNGFTQKGSLKQHLYLHAGLRPYSCSYCQSSFTQAKTLVNHLRRHTGEKPFPCEECGINFRQKDGLKRHMMTRHLKTQQKVFSCTICNKELNSKYSLDNHIRKHGKSEETTTDTESLEAPQKSSNDSSSECNEDFQVTKTHRVIITNSTDDSIQFLEVADESIQSKTDLYGNESS